MNRPRYANRRTVLKTITAAAVGGGIATGTAAGSRGNTPGKARGRRNVVEVTAEHDHGSGTHRFDLSRSKVESGWTTFEFDNESEHAHFTFLAKLPQQALIDAAEAGMTPLDFYVETLTKPFQYFMDTTYVGEKESDPADFEFVQSAYESDEPLLGLFLPWFPAVTFHGVWG